MDHPVITPEHIQFLSTRKLQTVAQTFDDEPTPPDEDVARWRRLAQYELRRRRGENPVKDRYGDA